MAFRFKSNVKDLLKATGKNIIDAMDETMAEGVLVAIPLTPVVTGIAQGSVRFNPAQQEGSKFVGTWGSFKVDYYIFLEIGARGRSGGHMLRQGADAAYPGLAKRIKRRIN